MQHLRPTRPGLRSGSLLAPARALGRRLARCRIGPNDDSTAHSNTICGEVTPLSDTGSRTCLDALRRSSTTRQDGSNRQPSQAVNVVCEGARRGKSPYGKKGNHYVGKTYVDRLGYRSRIADRGSVRGRRGQLWLHVWGELFDGYSDTSGDSRKLREADESAARHAGYGGPQGRPRLRPPVCPSPARTWKSWPWWESVRFWPAAC